jgi:hypothetical protein
MPRRSKLSEAQWEALFARDAAGEPRGRLAKAYGVAVGTIAWQARRRGRLKGLADGVVVDRRRRPEGGWPAGHVFVQSRSGMTPERWDQVLDRYAAGEDAAALGAEYGFHPASLAARAKAQRRRKCDLADAVYRPRGPWGCAPRAEMAFTFHRNDPEATRASLAQTVERAMDEGRLADATTLLRTWMTTQAYFEARRSLLGR